MSRLVQTLNLPEAQEKKESPTLSSHNLQALGEILESTDLPRLNSDQAPTPTALEHSTLAARKRQVDVPLAMDKFQAQLTSALKSATFHEPPVAHQYSSHTLIDQTPAPPPSPSAKSKITHRSTYRSVKPVPNVMEELLSARPPSRELLDSNRSFLLSNTSKYGLMERIARTVTTFVSQNWYYLRFIFIGLGIIIGVTFLAPLIAL